MNRHTRIRVWFLAFLFLTGCASTEVANRQILVKDGIPRPDQIWVYDFAASSADLHPDSVLADHDLEHDTAQTAHHLAAGRRLGAEIAADLVTRIRAMGMPAARASATTKAKLNDIVIHGYLISINEGRAKKRIALGLGAGSSELKTVVEGFQMTDQGLRRLGSGQVDAGSGKSPGAGVGVATLVATNNPAGLIVSTGVKVYGEASGKATIEGRADQTADEIADQVRIRFQEQGWI